MTEATHPTGCTCMVYTPAVRHVPSELLQRVETFGDWSVRVWRYEHPTRGLIEPALFWYEVVDRHVVVRTSAPAFTAADAALSAGCLAIADEHAAKVDRRVLKGRYAHQEPSQSSDHHARSGCFICEGVKRGTPCPLCDEPFVWPENYCATCEAVHVGPCPRPPDYRHALETVAEMIRGGDIDAALAHAEEVLRG